MARKKASAAATAVETRPDADADNEAGRERGPSWPPRSRAHRRSTRRGSTVAAALETGAITGERAAQRLIGLDRGEQVGLVKQIGLEPGGLGGIKPTLEVTRKPCALEPGRDAR